MPSGAEVPLIYKASAGIIAALWAFLTGKYFFDKKNDKEDKQRIDSQIQALMDKREEDIRKQAKLETKHEYLEKEQTETKKEVKELTSTVHSVQSLIQEVASDVKSILKIQEYKDKHEK